MEREKKKGMKARKFHQHPKKRKKKRYKDGQRKFVFNYFTKTTMDLLLPSLLLASTNRKVSDLENLNQLGSTENKNRGRKNY